MLIFYLRLLETSRLQKYHPLRFSHCVSFHKLTSHFIFNLTVFHTWKTEKLSSRICCVACLTSSIIKEIFLTANPLLSSQEILKIHHSSCVNPAVEILG